MAADQSRPPRGFSRNLYAKDQYQNYPNLKGCLEGASCPPVTIFTRSPGNRQVPLVQASLELGQVN
jgi:hypothetical protein